MSSAELPIEPMLSAAERRWNLATAISCVTVFGVGIGLAWPLRSLLLETRGVEATVNGLNGASAFLGVIIGPLLAPMIIRRTGLRPFLVGCLALDTVLFLSLKLLDDIVLWFALWMAMGIVGSGLFTATEAWITTTAGDKARGRVIGLYAASLSFGFMIGPLVLSLTGFVGWPPFVAGAAINGVAALPFLFTRNSTAGFGKGTPLTFVAVFVRAPVIVLAVMLFGFYESAAVTILPIWGVRIGFDPRVAAALLSALYLGSIALQWPIGILSDRVSRLLVLRLCTAAGLAGAVLLPFVSTTMFPLFAVVLLWGGFASGLYPVALSMAGDRFRGTEMVTANAVLIMGYGVGSSLGPVIGGVAMDLWNPHGVPAEFVLVFAAFLLLTAFAEPARSTARPPIRRSER